MTAGGATAEGGAASLFLEVGGYSHYSRAYNIT